MTNLEHFINDVTNDAFLMAVENQSGKVTHTQLDDIIREHPYYEQVSLDSIKAGRGYWHGVVEIEKILQKNNRLLTK